jgi:hypothetical protein
VTQRLAWLAPFALCTLFGNAALGDEASQRVLDVGGTVVDWSYCGDVKFCTSGPKLLCRFPSAADHAVKAGEARCA